MKKSELLEHLESQREKFMDALEDLPEGTWEQPGVAGIWSIKDILMHISRWEAELVKLLWQAQQGQRPTSIHFEGVNVDEVNARWYAENRDRSIEKVLEDFQAVRTQTILRVEALNEKDLNDPQRYPWSSGKPLAEWIENDSYGHDEEHLADVLRWKKGTSP